MRWIAGGIAGWLAAVAPLLAVNIAGYASVFDSDTAVIAGAIALIGSIALGGLAAGLVAGRPSATRAGGALTALPAGILAAVLYIASLMTVVVVAIRIDAAPSVVANHPVRITGAVVCLGAILLGMSLVFGFIAGRRAHQAAFPSHSESHASAQQGMPRSPAPSQPRYGGYSSQPSRGAYPDTNLPGPDARDGYIGQSSAYSDPRGYDNSSRRGNSHSGERQPTHYPSGPSPRQSGSHAGRDDDWRDGGR